MSEVVDELLIVASQARREHRSASARQVLLNAVEICRQSNDRERLAKALTALAQAERDLHHLDSARQLFEEAALIYHADGHQLRLAHTFRHVADIHLDQGNHAPAERCYDLALEIYRNHPDTPLLDLANAIRGLAILKGEIRQNQQAILLWREAGELYAAVDVQAGVAESGHRIGLLTAE
jgi:tetratricopeptide (TPR) repeat protein